MALRKFYATAQVRQIVCNFEPVKTRWLRRTLYWACTSCGRRKRVGARRLPPICERGQAQEVSDSGALVLHHLIRTLGDAGHTKATIPWRNIQLQLDHDANFLVDRIIATVDAEEKP